MRVYHMDLSSVMRLPMKTFWHLQGSITRLLADEQKELLELLTSSQNSEAAEQLRAALAKQSPQPIKLTGQALMELTSDRDETGFEELRAM
jgi:hypothetical protein